MMVPKMRFKEFSDEWKKDRLVNISAIKKGNGLSKSDLSVNGTECILYGELYTTYNDVIREIHSRTLKRCRSFVYSKINDVIIPASGETPIDIAKASCILKDNVILGGDLNIITLNNIDGRFFSYEINSKKKIELANLAQGNSVVHLYGDKFKKIFIEYPSIKEQGKIANMLELLDKKIELQLHKIKVLKLYKKGLMHDIFSNAYIPYKLRKLCIINKGKQLNHENMTEYGNYYVINGGIEPSGYFDSYNTLENTISISEGGNSCGFINYNHKPFWSGGHCYTLTVNISLINNEYLYQLLKNNEKMIMKLRVGSGLPNIQKNALENFSVTIHSLVEQLKYANILMKTDQKIKLEQNMVNKLIELKKGLMQNIFV